MNHLKRAAEFIKHHNITISTAESLTGGMIASELVGVSGISAVFHRGYITYSNDSKSEILGVRSTTLEKYGAVSVQTAREMAKYVRAVSKSDIGLASTGIAGPMGGSVQKPVGLVYLSCAIDDYVVTRKYIFSGSRKKIRRLSTKAAFRLLDDCLNKYYG